MERLNHFVTRLLIVALLALAAWVGRAWIAKQALVYHIESFTGAKVDARQLSMQADDSTIFLGEVEFADPHQDRKNLLQFEAASLRVDFEQLKNRRLVIEDGRVSQVKLGSPRTRTGRLKPWLAVPNLSSNGSGNYPEVLAGQPSGGTEAPGANAQRWRDSLVVDLTTTDPNQESFLVVPLLKQKVQQWSQRLQAPSQQMTQVDQSLSMVEEVLSDRFELHNPLRSGDKLAKAFEALKSTRKSLETMATQISDFESLSQKDSYELSQAQIKDRQLLLAANPQQKFDSKLINEMLVGELQRELVGSAIEWFQQFRSSIPNPSTDFRSVQRGTNLYFGTEKISQFEIQKLQIDGSTEFANNHFQFAGEIQNVSADLANNDQPMKFDLRAQGDPQVVVSGTIDRREGSNFESIQFTGHAIPQPARILGSDGSVQMSIAGNSRLHVEADLRANELNQISGAITFSFEDVIMHADHVHAVAGGEGTAARINETASSLNSFQIRSTLGGTINLPTSDFVSDLGPKIASSLEAFFLESNQLAMKKKEHRLSKAVDGDLATFKENLSQGLSRLNESWRTNKSRLERLQKKLQVAAGPEFNRRNQLR